MEEKKYNNNNMKITNIKELIDYYDLDYCIVVVGILNKNNKKEVVGRNHGITDLDDSKIQQLIYGITQKDISEYYICYEIKIKDTGILIIDIDEDITIEDVYKLYPDLKNTYYTLGNNKGFHFYICAKYTYGMSSHNKTLNHIEGDFIKQQIWEKVDKKVFGDDLFKIDENQIKNYFKEYPFDFISQGTNNIIKDLTSNTIPFENQIQNLDELKEIVNNIPKKYSDNYDDWIKIISILKKYNQYDLAFTFSKKSLKFDCVEVFNDWYYNKTINCNTLNIGTIFEYSKFNKTEFNKIKNKYRRIEDKRKQLEMLEEIDLNNSAEFEIMKEEFEETHFKIINSNCYIKLLEDRILFLTKREILDMYIHKKFMGYDEKGNLKKISFIDKWVSCEEILYYENCDYFPNDKLCPSNYYNLWTGFAVEKYPDDFCDPDDLQVILNHIKLICGCDLEVYEYMLDWFAHLFLYPEEKIGIFPIFQGNTGTGKSMILHMIKSMIGNDKCGFTNNAKDEIFGSFNPLMSGKIFMELAELDFLATKGLEGKFKSLITDNTISINDKGTKLRQEISYHRFIATTNNDIPIKITDNDRRILLIETSDAMKGNIEYFNKLALIIQDKKVQKTFYNFLISRDNVFTSPAEAKSRLPITQVQQELIEYFTPTEELFFKELVNNYYDPNKSIIRKSAKNIYKEYIEYCANAGLEAMSQTKLGFRLKKKYKNCIKKIKQTYIIYIIDTTHPQVIDLLDNTNILIESDSD